METSEYILCKYCRYFVSSPNSSYGNCMLNPPQFVEQSNGEQEWQHPEVYKEWFCQNFTKQIPSRKINE